MGADPTDRSWPQADCRVSIAVREKQTAGPSLGDRRFLN